MSELRRDTGEISPDQTMAELFSGIESKLARVDPNQLSEITTISRLQNYFADFEANHNVDAEEFEIARLVVANRTYGWLQSDESMLDQWQRLNSVYREFNDGNGEPCAVIELNEGLASERSPLGHYIAISSDALTLDTLEIKKPRLNYTFSNLKSDVEGHGTTFLGSGRNLPNVSTNIDEQKLLLMLLESNGSGEPLESRGDKYNHDGRRFYVALGHEAVVGLLDQVYDSDEFSAELLFEQFGRLGLPVQESQLYKGFEFDTELGTIQESELAQRLVRALFGNMSIMPEEVKGKVARFGLDSRDVLAETEETYTKISDLRLVAPWIFEVLQKDLPAYFEGKQIDPEQQPNGASVQLQAYIRNKDGFDRALIAHALGVTPVASDKG